MSRVYIELPEKERKAIMGIAKEELRPLKQQILYLLRAKLREEGVISKDNLEKEAKLHD